VKDWSREQISTRIAELGPWFHNLNLAGIATAPDHFLHDYPRNKFSRFAHAIPDDLSGKTVLDIGCNAGFYSMEMERRGAARVLGIDYDDRYLEQARFAAKVLGSKVEFRKLSVYDLALLGERFDLVLFMGVLYHLRHPLLALDLIHEHVAGDLMLFQTMQRGSDAVDKVKRNYPFTETAHFNKPGYPKLHFIEHDYANDWTNWWAPNAAATQAMLRSAGFAIVAHPESEVYLCRRLEEAGHPPVYPAPPEGRLR
jgi:tRNA (mo5U34)-methyltransferase